MIPNMKTTTTQTGRIAEVQRTQRFAKKIMEYFLCAAPCPWRLSVCLWLVTMTMATAATNDLSGLLQKGLFEEEANRNLDAASAAYESLVKQLDKDRQIGATAIFRLGEVYRKQGKTNEAAVQYERIVRDFAEQTTLVTLSRQNLAGLGVAAKPAGGQTPAATSRSAEAQELERSEKILAQLSDWDVPQLRKMIPTLLPDAEFERVNEQLRMNEAFGENADRQILNQRTAYHNQLQKRAEEIMVMLERRVKLLREVVAKQNATGNATVVENKSTITTVVDEEEAEIRRIQAMIRNSPDLINAASGDPFVTPLCRAASKGQLRVARFLLDNGALVDQKSVVGNSSVADRTALSYASSSGHRAMVELLLSRNANVNARDKSGYTALHIAAQKGFQSVAEVLVSGKADINAPANWRETPLRLAAEKGHDEMAVFLIAKGADVNAPDGNNLTPLHWAASQGHREVLQHLVAAKAGLNALDKNGQPALSLAAEARHLETVKALLQAGADPNTGKANPPLHCAIKARAVDVVQALLKAGTDANLGAKVTWQLRYPDGAERALSADKTVTPLALAMSDYKTEIAKLLLAAKADPNGKRLDGVPLVFSALNDTDVLQAFLDAGANPNAVDASRQPSATLLGRSLNPKIIRMLLAAGAKPNVPSAGFEPLIWAANLDERNRDTAKELADALLTGGADVHVTLADGRTALHLAAQRQNRELAKVLLAFKADVNARDDQGLTPLDYALGRNRSQGGGGYTVTSPISRFAGDPVDLGENSVATLLRQSGGLDNLPDLRTISVSWAVSGYRATVFPIGTNDWSRYTLTELVAQKLGLLSIQTQGAAGRRSNFRSIIWGQSPIRFPDYSGSVIHRPTKDGKSRTRIPVVFLIKADGSEKQTDWLLEPGDMVEIPESDHPVSDSWPGPSAADLATWTNVLSRSVTVVIGGKTTELKLATEVEIFTASVPEQVIITPVSFMVRAVLDQSKLVRYSSDLTRVKVTRAKGANGKRQEWVVDCSGAGGTFPDLWLQGGDEIEVPDKP
jgi:ankyrin repeat protein